MKVGAHGVSCGRQPARCCAARGVARASGGSVAVPPALSRKPRPSGAAPAALAQASTTSAAPMHPRRSSRVGWEGLGRAAAVWFPAAAGAWWQHRRGAAARRQCRGRWPWGRPVLSLPRCLLAPPARCLRCPPAGKWVLVEGGEEALKEAVLTKGPMIVSSEQRLHAWQHAWHPARMHTPAWLPAWQPARLPCACCVLPAAASLPPPAPLPSPPLAKKAPAAAASPAFRRRRRTPQSTPATTPSASTREASTRAPPAPQPPLTWTTPSSSGGGPVRPPRRAVLGRQAVPGRGRGCRAGIGGGDAGRGEGGGWREATHAVAPLISACGGLPARPPPPRLPPPAAATAPARPASCTGWSRTSGAPTG